MNSISPNDDSLVILWVPDSYKDDDSDLEAFREDYMKLDFTDNNPSCLPLLPVKQESERYPSPLHDPPTEPCSSLGLFQRIFPNPQEEISSPLTSPIHLLKSIENDGSRSMVELTTIWLDSLIPFVIGGQLDQFNLAINHHHHHYPITTSSSHKSLDLTNHRFLVSFEDFLYREYQFPFRGRLDDLISFFNSNHVSVKQDLVFPTFKTFQVKIDQIYKAKFKFLQYKGLFGHPRTFRYHDFLLHLLVHGEDPTWYHSYTSNDLFKGQQVCGITFKLKGLPNQ